MCAVQDRIVRFIQINDGNALGRMPLDHISTLQVFLSHSSQTVQHALKGGGLRQICKVCRKVDKFDFTVNNAKWAEIVPEEYQNRVVCLCCFDRFAREKRVDYARNITTLYFAGDQASLSFRVKTRRENGG